MSAPVVANRADVVSLAGLNARLVEALGTVGPVGDRLRATINAALASGAAGQAMHVLEKGAVRPNGLLPSIIQRKGTYRNVLGNPRGKAVSGSAPTGWYLGESAAVGTTVTQMTFEDGTSGVRVRIPAGAAAVSYRYLAISPATGTAFNTLVPTTTPVAFPMRVRASAANEQAVSIQQGDGLGGAGASVPVPFTTAWASITPRFVAAATPSATSVLYLTLPAASSAQERTWDFQSIGVVVGLYDGPFFDGDSGPAAWTGATNTSVSETYPGALSVWDGTSETWVGSAAAANFLPLTARGTASGVAALDASSRLLIPGGAEVTAVAAPTTNPATGKIIWYLDSADNHLRFRDAAGTVRRSTSDWGEGTALPSSGMLRGDVYRHTGLACLMVYTGTAWRQVGPVRVTDAAARTAISTSYAALLYPGFEVRQENTGYTYAWDGSAWQFSAGPASTGGLTFSTGFSAGADGVSWRLRDGICTFRGHFNRDTGTRAGSIGFFPVGVRPATVHWWLANNAAAIVGEIKLHPNGDLHLNANGVNTTLLPFVVSGAFAVEIEA